MKLELKNISKKFGKQQALFPIDLDIPESKILAFIGPSGSGKSTLLKILAGLVKPDSGSFVVNDKLVEYEENKIIDYRRNLGIVFQSWNLFPHLTALDNIVLPLHHVHGYSLEEAKNRSMELLNRFELGSHANKKPYALSGGQAQRVAIIRAMAAQPQVLMMDEPTSALDPYMTVEVLELINEIKEEGRDIVLVTHHISFAKKISDYTLFIQEGRLIEHGKNVDIYDHPKSESLGRFMKQIKKFESMN